MRDKLIGVGFLALAVLAVLMVFGGHGNSSHSWIASANSNTDGAMQVQIVGGSGSGTGPIATVASAAKQTLHFPTLSQRDKTQYASDDEWQTWAASACSATALTDVLDGYGAHLRITDVLNQMEQQNAIKAGAGLYRYEVFGTIAAQYNLRTIYSDDKDVDAHFNRILSYLQQGYPVIINVLDATYFPSGHFIVATGINPDGTIAVLNPDPTTDKSVSQSWPQDGLKLYFSRMTRSAAILPNS